MKRPLPRREFTKSLLAASACTAWATHISASSAHAGQFTTKIKKAVKYHMITEELSVIDKLKMLKDIGFDGVEPKTSDAQANLKDFIRASQVTGIEVHGIVNSSNPDIKSAIDVAREVGASSVLVVVPIDTQGSYLANYQARQQIIREAIPHAEKQNIKILIENVWASFLIEPIGMLRFVEELNSDAVGVYFDVGNNIRWGYAEHWIEVLGKSIGKLDIKEFDRKLQNEQGLRAGFNTEIGDGSVDWKRVRDELAKIDYTGWATAEVRGGDRARLADIAARMNRVLDI
jgi:hexulose-6-phosphate isomerase